MTDLQKFKNLLNEMNILYMEDGCPSYSVCRYNKNGFGHEDEYKTDVIRLYIHDSHLQYNYGATVGIIFDAANESFIAFESWGE